MLYIIFQNIMSEEEASQKLGRKVIEYTSQEFETKRRHHDLNTDEFFIKCLKDIVKCDIPMKNVLRDLATGNTYSFDKVPGSIKSLWLMYHYSNDYIFPTRYFGQNCYQLVVEISKDIDIYLYDDAEIINEEESNECVGVFTDFHTGDVVRFENEEAYQYVTEKGYY